MKKSIFMGFPMASCKELWKWAWAKGSGRNFTLSRRVRFLCATGCWLGASLFSAQLSWAEVETITLGEAERPWDAGGGDGASAPPTITPLFRQDPRTAGSGNAPGGIIDFGVEPGWIVPAQIDPERNLFEQIREQGGSPSISSPNVSDISRAELEKLLKSIIDGSEGVYVRKSTPTKRNVNPLGEHIDIDLGARFGIEQIRFFPSVFFPGDFLKAFEISLNDGSAASLTESGNPIWTLAFRNSQNVRSTTNVAVPLQFVRHMRLTSLTTVGFEIDEIELYGRGYVPSSRYLTDIFDLGEKQAVWGKLRWSEKHRADSLFVGDPQRARITVRSRSGKTPNPLIFTRVVTSLSLSEEPFLFELDRVSYDRAAQGIDFALAPAEWPEQAIAPAVYDTLSPEIGIGAWLEVVGARFAVIDDAGVEEATDRATYEDAKLENRAAVAVPAVAISKEEYLSFSLEFKDWLQARATRYLRRGNIGENVPYSIDGAVLTEKLYNRLSSEQRGPMLEDVRNWSPWSAPYPASGGSEGIPITSPSPRRYIQFEIRFESESIESTRQVDFLSFELSSPPVAQRLIGEIFPRSVKPGENVEFTYAVRPFLDPAGDLGFDSFEVQTPVPIQRLGKVQIFGPEGGPEPLVEQVFGEAVEELTLPYTKGEVTLDSVGMERFRIKFPPITTDGSMLKLSFATSVLRYGTTFNGWGFNSEVKGLPQPVFPADVAQLDDDCECPGETDLSNLSGLTVFIDLTGQLLSDVEVSPNPFTPNGDQVNDEAEIFYDLLKLTDPAPVLINLYNLAGQPVRTLQSEVRQSGRFSVFWDGANDAGQKVLPGLYLFKIQVKSDERNQEVLGTVSVAY